MYKLKTVLLLLLLSYVDDDISSRAELLLRLDTCVEGKSHIMSVVIHDVGACSVDHVHKHLVLNDNIRGINERDPKTGTTVCSGTVKSPSSYHQHRQNKMMM